MSVEIKRNLDGFGGYRIAAGGRFVANVWKTGSRWLCCGRMFKTRKAAAAYALERHTRRGKGARG